MTKDSVELAQLLVETPKVNQLFCLHSICQDGIYLKSRSRRSFHLWGPAAEIPMGDRVRAWIAHHKALRTMCLGARTRFGLWRNIGKLQNEPIVEFCQTCANNVHDDEQLHKNHTRSHSECVFVQLSIILNTCCATLTKLEHQRTSSVLRA